jgi:4-hydroxybenzoate polyprenyltransferase
VKGADLVRMLRPHQWAKNLLTLVPVIAAGRWESAASWLAGGCAFVAFSLMASSGYLINDVRDVEDDRSHPTKRARPIAAGRVSAGVAWTVAAVLAAASLGVALLAGGGLRWALLAYLGATLVYTAVLKQYFLADTMTLAALFTIRIVGGCAALAVKPSIWLLSVSMFVFFSLALTKRFRELQLASGGSVKSSRDYGLKDKDLVRTLGLSSATVAVLVVALYLESARALAVYREASWLWFACPVIWYWLIRIWSKCDRGELDDDPVLFALKDRGSWLCLAAIGACWIAAIAGVPGVIGP